MGSFKDGKSPQCPQSHDHLVYPVFISPSLSYYYCKDCQKEVGGNSLNHKLGKFTLLDGSPYKNLTLFSDVYPMTANLVGRRESGKTEVIKSILQKSINEGVDHSKIFIFDTDESYTDWVKQNKGLVVSSASMLRSLVRQNKTIGSYSIICINGNVLTDDESVDLFIEELRDIIFSSRIESIKKTIVIDSHDELISKCVQINSLISSCLNKSVSNNISILVASHSVLDDGIFQAIGNVLLFEPASHSYPPELKLFFDLDPKKLPSVGTLGVYSNREHIDHVRFIHVAAHFSRNYQYFNIVKHIVT